MCPARAGDKREDAAACEGLRSGGAPRAGKQTAWTASQDVTRRETGPTGGAEPAP